MIWWGCLGSGSGLWMKIEVGVACGCGLWMELVDGELV